MEAIVSGIVFSRGVSKVRDGNKSFRTLVLLQTLRELEKYCFIFSKSLRRLTFRDGNSLERIGDFCLNESGIMKMRLPKTLKYLGGHIFQRCLNHPKIYIDDGFPHDLHANPLDGASGGPPPGTLAGGVLVWDLRTLRHVVIPEGTERIGNHWFYNCGIGSVVIPASVKSIELEAFSMCIGLKTVEFAPDSRLEKVGKRSFWATNLERITIPRSVTTIE